MWKVLCRFCKLHKRVLVSSESTIRYPPFDNLILWFVSLNAKGFWPQNFLGSCLNYLMHESWFYLTKIKSVFVAVEKGTTFWQNVTECHTQQQAKFNLWWVIGWQWVVATNKQTAFLGCRSWICHALQQPDIDDAAHMQNRSSPFKIWKLRPKMPWDVARIFSESLDKDLLESRHTDLNQVFETVNSKTTHCLRHLNSFKIHSSTPHR